MTGSLLHRGWEWKMIELTLENSEQFLFFFKALIEIPVNMLCHSNFGFPIECLNPSFHTVSLKTRLATTLGPSHCTLGIDLRENKTHVCSKTCP